MLKELRLYDTIISMDVELIHKPRRDNSVPNALSRREELMTPRIVALVGEEFDEVKRSFLHEVQEAMKNDEDAIFNNEIFDAKKGVSARSGQRICNLRRKNGLHYFIQGQLYVLAGELWKKLLKYYHNIPLARYEGVKAIQTELAKKYFWPHIALDIEVYVKTCVKCQMKESTQPKIGMLQPLFIPKAPFQLILIDFKTAFPKSRKSNAIMVIV